MDRCLQLVALALAASAAIATSPAHAAYTTMPTPPGFGGGNPLTYGGNALATFVWANQKVQGVVNGAGTTFPFTAAAGSGAGSALAVAARATAWGTVGIGAAWLLGYGLEYIAGEWKKKQTTGNGEWVCSYNGQPGPCGSVSWGKSLMCQVNCTGYGDGWWDQPDANGIPARYNETWQYGVLRLTVAIGYKCPNGQTVSNAGQCVASGYAPATPEDWVPVETAPPGSIPDDVLNDARPKVAVPVELPVYSGGPKAIPLGDPQPNPTGTGWGQPQQWVAPKPTTGEPWRFDSQWRLVPTTGPDSGATAPYSPSASSPTGAGPAPVVVVNPGTETEGTPEEEPKSQCELTPDASGCVPLGAGTGPDTPLTVTPISLSITPASGFGPSTTACPAPRQITVAGKTLSFSMQMLCDFADGIRPILVGIAWITAVFSFMGLSRNKD